MNPTEPRRDFLANHQFFDDCAPLIRARLLPHLKERKVAAGEVLAGSGEPLEEVFFLASGGLLFIPDQGDPVPVGICGEEGLLGIDAGIGRVTAAVDSLVYVISLDFLKDLETSCPGIIRRASRSLAARFTGPMSTVASAAEADRSSGSWREVAGWIMAMLVPAVLLFSLRHNPVLTALHSRYFLAILSSVAVMWMFRLLPDFIPVLFGVLAMIIFGVAPPQTILSGFASDSFFMAMSVLGLGTVIRASGLGFRVLLLLIGARPKSRWWHNFCVFMVGLILTPIIPSANGRVAIVSPFVQELLGSLTGSARKRAAARLSISALAGTSIFSAIFLSSKSINFIMFGYLPAQEQLRFQWVYWLVAASAAGLALLLFFLVFWSIFFRSEGVANLGRETVRSQIALLGPLSAAEIAALAGVFAFAISLATSAIHRIEVPWIALSVLFGLLMFGFLDRDAFRRSIDWSFLFFLGGLIGMVKTMRAVGVDLWLADKCSWLTGYMVHDLNLFIILLALTVFAVRLMLPINATAVIFLTLLMPAAQASGVNPWIIGFMVLFLAETWLMPYQASYYLQYCSLTGYGHPSQDRRTVPFNLLIIVMKVAAIYLSLPWWRFLGLL